MSGYREKMEEASSEKKMEREDMPEKWDLRRTRWEEKHCKVFYKWGAYVRAIK